MIMLDVLLSIVYPDLHQCGKQVMAHLLWLNDIRPALDHWLTAFNAITIISNCKTPLHRNYHTRSSWYDLMATVGNYDEVILELSTFGLQLLYLTGMAVFFSGKMVRHGVSTISHGDRLCFAFYMCDRVHEHCGVECEQEVKVLTQSRLCLYASVRQLSANRAGSINSPSRRRILENVSFLFAIP